MNNIRVNGAPQRKVLLGTIYGVSYWGVLGHIHGVLGHICVWVIVTYCNVTNCNVTNMYSKLSYQDSRLTYIDNTTKLDFQNVLRKQIGNSYIRIAAQPFQGFSLENKDLEFVDSGVFVK